MMSRWDLGALDWSRINCPVTLVAGTADRMVPPDTSVRAASLLRHSDVVKLPGLGHLAHEEAPARIAGLIGDAFEASFPQRRAVA
jgi:magnesium chelatase accessory protein